MMNCFGDKDTEILLLQNSEKQLMQRIKQLDIVLTALREELAMWKGRTSNVCMKLTAAEQRNAELLQICRDIQPLITAEPLGVLSGMSDQSKRLDWYEKLSPVRERLDAALNPAESGASEVAKQALLMESQRIMPARFKCLACRGYHEGSSNLPCPRMTPYSGNKP